MQRLGRIVLTALELVLEGLFVLALSFAGGHLALRLASLTLGPAEREAALREARGMNPAQLFRRAWHIYWRNYSHTRQTCGTICTWAALGPAIASMGTAALVLIFLLRAELLSVASHVLMTPGLAVLGVALLPSMDVPQGRWMRHVAWLIACGALLGLVTDASGDPLDVMLAIGLVLLAVAMIAVGIDAGRPADVRRIAHPAMALAGLAALLIGASDAAWAATADVAVDLRIGTAVCGMGATVASVGFLSRVRFSAPQ